MFSTISNYVDNVGQHKYAYFMHLLFGGEEIGIDGEIGTNGG